MTTMQLPPELARLFADFDRDNLRREHETVAADPQKHKLTRVMLGRYGLNYNYLTAGVNGKGQSVCFCWSTHRNAAGYFLGWRQTRMIKGTVKRDRWVARKQRNAVAKVAERRVAAFRKAVVA